MKHLEDNLQQSVVKYFRLMFPACTIFAVPNGGNRNAREGARLKKQGVLAGVSDLVLVFPNRIIFVELKIGKNKQQATQKQFQSNVQMMGHEYYLIYSIDEFIKLSKGW